MVSRVYSHDRESKVDEIVRGRDDDDDDEQPPRALSIRDQTLRNA